MNPTQVRNEIGHPVVLGTIGATPTFAIRTMFGSVNTLGPRDDVDEVDTVPLVDRSFKKVDRLSELSHGLAQLSVRLIEPMR